MSSISNYNQQAVEISKRVHAERQLGNRKALFDFDEKRINKWREKQAMTRTKKRRPDLLE